MKKSNLKRFGALVIGLSFVAVSCGGSSDTATDTTTPAATAGGDLEGMKGTMPLVELSAEFKDAVNAYWTAAGNEALVDYSYTAEAFDAVTLIALAAEAA